MNPFDLYENYIDLGYGYLIKRGTKITPEIKRDYYYWAKWQRQMMVIEDKNIEDRSVFFLSLKQLKEETYEHNRDKK